MHIPAQFATVAPHECWPRCACAAAAPRFSHRKLVVPLPTALRARRGEDGLLDVLKV